MDKRRRWIEWGKNLLIVLLLGSAALLLRYTGFYAPLRERAGTEAADLSGGAGVYDTEAGLAQARPLAVAVVDDSGSCCAFAYDRDDVADVFGDFSAALGEALGSATEAQPVTEEQWREALEANAVFFEYAYPQPLSLLSSWLGISGGSAGEFQARRLLITYGAEQAVLFFQDAGDESGFYRCGTAVSGTTVRLRAEAYRRNNASFAFQYGSLEALEPYTVVLQSLPACFRAECASAVDNGFDLGRLMSLLGMNSYVTKQYLEADGTRVYIENGRSLRVDAAGHISCKSGAAVTVEESAGLTDAVRTAFTFVQTSVGASSGDGELRFSGVESYGDGVYAVDFQYSLDGVNVELPSGSAARVTVKRGAVIQAELTPRVYHLSDTECSLLPMPLAAAAAAVRGGSLRLLYMDSGSASECAWVG